ncbi:MAG: HAD family hydrolase [Clostridia bacterium]
MIKAVIFDFDGVVADTGRDIVASVQAAQKEYGEPVLDYDTILSYVGHGAKYLLDCALPSLSESKRAEALAWYKQYYQAHPCDATQLYEGFAALAETLARRGVAMSIVSNKPEPITHLIVKRLGIARYFTKVIGPESVARMKPDPEGLLLCLKAMQAAPEEAIMAGDSYTDIQAGKAAGMYTCAILYGYGDKEKLKAENADVSASAAIEILQGIESL